MDEQAVTGPGEAVQPAGDKPLIAALLGQKVTTPSFWLMRQAGRYLPEYRRLRSEAPGFVEFCLDPEMASEATLQPIRRFGMDGAIIFSDILLVPWALGQPLRFAEGEGPKLDPVRDAAGLDRLRQICDTEQLEPVYEALRRTRAALPAQTALIGFAGAPWTLATYVVEGGSSRSFEHVKRWAREDTAGFERLIERLTDSVILHLDRQIAAGAEIVQIFDSWAGVLDRSSLEQWVIAPTRRIVEALRRSAPQVPIIGFPKGIGEHVIGYVHETGVTAVAIDQHQPLDVARDVLQPVAAVQGNLDPELLVAGGQAMVDRIHQIVKTLGGGRFVFNLGHGVVPQTPVDHVALLTDTLRGLRLS